MRTDARVGCVAASLVAAAALSLALAGGAAATAPVTATSDSLRTGWYPDERALSPAVVAGGSFGPRFDVRLDGPVVAQPLVAGGTLLVATEANSIYGLDPATGATRWTRNLGPAWDPNAQWSDCALEKPTSGITGTPVIDPDTNTAYLFSNTYASGSAGPAAWDLHAVDLATGAERSGFPLRLPQRAADNQPGTTFNPTTQLQRPGLLLMNGVVYAGFGSHCDDGTYQGWVVGVSTTGQVKAMWSTRAANAAGASIWQGGGGIVSDGPGQIVVATGNGGTPSVATPGSSPPADLGNSVIRLHVQADGTLAATDFFTPYASLSERWDATDEDFGSGSPVGLPDALGTASTPHLMVVSGKSGVVYLLNRDDLGGFDQGTAAAPDRIVATGGAPLGSIMSRFAVWPGDGGYIWVPTVDLGWLNVGSQTSSLDVYRVTRSGGEAGLSQVAATDPTAAPGYFGYGSGQPVVTSDGTTPGSALVWIVRVPKGQNTRLEAYPAVPSGSRPVRIFSADTGGSPAKFSAPGVAGGRVYVGTGDSRIVAYGPADAPAAQPAPVAAPPAPPQPRLLPEPTLSRLAIAPRAFAAGSGHGGGATISFVLSVQATVRFQVERYVRSRCRRSARRHRRCWRLVPLAGAYAWSAHAGANRVAFHPRLPRGRYRLAIVTPGLTTGGSRTVDFRIVARRRRRGRVVRFSFSRLAWP